jgi:CelD/BcsL family acetyltransferase involved in cellulose biosynthesis
VKTGFDPAYSAFAPGTLLRQEMIARAFSTGVERYEFLGRDEPWKLEWTDAACERVRLQAFAPSLPGFVDRAAYAVGRPLSALVLAWFAG